MIEVARGRFAPAADAVGAARRFVERHVGLLGLQGRCDDVNLVVTELATNAVIHGRSMFAVRLLALPDGGRIEVSDTSPTLPAAGTLALTALSGRGLVLVRALSSRWGAEREEQGGKTVWCELASRPPAGACGFGPEDLDVDALLASWAHDEPSATSGRLEAVVPEVCVPTLLAAKTRMEDLLREAQLILVSFPRAAAVPAPMQRIWLAVHELVEAAASFGEGRRQVRSQLVAARDAGLSTVTLHLQLPAGSASLVARYRRAVEEVQRAHEAIAGRALPSPLTAMTGLEHLARYDEARRHYLDVILAQVAASV